MDVRREFPFEAEKFDLILAMMVFNELNPQDLVHTVSECSRVLQDSGRLLATVVHPDFVARLEKNGKLSQLGPHFWTMPGKGSMRLPVVPRSEATYERILVSAGFTFDSVAVHSSPEMIQERPGLRYADGIPLALVFDCTKVSPKAETL